MENSAVSDLISCHTTQWRKPAQVQHPLNDVSAMDHTTSPFDVAKRSIHKGLPLLSLVEAVLLC